MARASRRRSAGGVALVVVLLCACSGLLVVGVAVGEEGCAPVASAEVPAVAARDGTPFAVLVTFADCAESVYGEIRVWVGDDARQASKVWNGTAWAASTRYQQISAFGEEGGARIIGTKATPDATHGDAIVTTPAGADVRLKARGPDGTSAIVFLGSITWVDADAVKGRWIDDVSPVLAVRGGAGELMGAAPSGIDGDGLPLPDRFAWVALPEGAPAGAASPMASRGLLFSRVAPAVEPGGLDLVEVAWAGDEPLDVRGLRVDDGEGRWILTEGTVPPRGTLVITEAVDVSLMPWSAFRDEAPITTPSGTHTSATFIEAGPFALSATGDAVSLAFGDVLPDEFAYGDAQPVGAWQGPPVEAARLDDRVFVRAGVPGNLTDTDSASDWDNPRIFRVLQQDLSAPWFDVAGPVRAFVCPDRCFDEVLARVQAATSSIEVNLYDLTLRALVDAMAEAEGRGVEVRVLLHPRPVGASSAAMDRLAFAVDALRAAGAEVHVHDGRRFDVAHAKYLVVDQSWTVVLSENANAHGWPENGRHGNRGWGVAVHDGPLAAWMDAMFEADFSHPSDTHAVQGSDLQPDALAPLWPDAGPPASGRLQTFQREGPVRVRPVVAPDHLGDPARSPLVAALTGASTEIWTQQLNLPLVWQRPGHAGDSPLVVAMDAAAARGIPVKGVLAGDFEDGDVHTDGNDRTAGVLSLRANVSLRLGDAPVSNAGIVHNKGWLVDPTPGGRNLVVVGSANGNLASQAMNREVDLFIEDAAIAAYFRAVLAADFAAATPPPAPADPDASAVVVPGASLLLLASTLAVAVWLRRNRPPTVLS